MITDYTKYAGAPEEVITADDLKDENTNADPNEYVTEETIPMVTNTFVNFRSGCTKEENNVIIAIPKGTKVKTALVEELINFDMDLAEDGWTAIVHMNRPGFVKSEFLDKE